MKPYLINVIFWGHEERSADVAHLYKSAQRTLHIYIELGKPWHQHMRVYLALTVMRLLRNHAHIAAKSETCTTSSFAAAAGRPRLFAAAFGAAGCPLMLFVSLTRQADDGICSMPRRAAARAGHSALSALATKKSTFFPF